MAELMAELLWRKVPMGLSKSNETIDGAVLDV